MAEPVDILLVEDDPDHAELTLRALRGNHVANRIQVVGDGADALAYLQPENAEATPDQGRPTLVVLDLKLPRVDGLEVLQRLKASPSTRNIPVIVLTSSREEADVVASYEYGVNRYVVKPVRFDTFQKAVNELGLSWLLVNGTPPE